MKTNKLILKLGIVTLLLSSAVIMADDDDDEDEHHSWGNSSRQVNARELEPLPQAPPQFKKECASCHMLYHPGLLPQSSWKKIMAGLDKHFGENAELDVKTKTIIEDFLVKHSADQSSARRSSRILENLGTNKSPLRFTETNYFKRQHHEINPSVYKRSKIGSSANCIACHKNAEAGIFNEREVQIPRF